MDKNVNGEMTKREKNVQFYIGATVGMIVGLFVGKFLSTNALSRDNDVRISHVSTKDNISINKRRLRSKSASRCEDKTAGGSTLVALISSTANDFKLNVNSAKTPSGKKMKLHKISPTVETYIQIITNADKKKRSLLEASFPNESCSLNAENTTRTLNAQEDGIPDDSVPKSNNLLATRNDITKCSSTKCLSRDNFERNISFQTSRAPSNNVEWADTTLCNTTKMI